MKRIQKLGTSYPLNEPGPLQRISQLVHPAGHDNPLQREHTLEARILDQKQSAQDVQRYPVMARPNAGGYNVLLWVAIEFHYCAVFRIDGISHAIAVSGKNGKESAKILSLKYFYKYAFEN